MGYTSTTSNSNKNGNWNIYIIDADGNNLKRLTDDLSGNFKPVWSPDGEKSPSNQIETKILIFMLWIKMETI